MQNDPVAALVAKLEQGGFAPRPTGSDSWESRCPAHGGRRRNLSVRTGDDGKALIHCHREPACEPPKIMAAIGMTMADLFPSGPACTPPSGDDKANARPKPKRLRLSNTRGRAGQGDSRTWRTNRVLDLQRHRWFRRIPSLPIRREESEDRRA